MRKFVALIVFIFPFLPLACGALGLLAVNSWILDRSFYTGVVDDPRLYDALLDEDLPAYLMQEAENTGSNIPAAALTAGLQAINTSDFAITDYIRNQAVEVVNHVFDFVDGPSTVLNPSFDLKPIREALSEPATRTAFSQAVAENLPECTSNQSAYPSGTKLPVCRPANETPGSMAEQIQKALPGIIETLPDTIALGDSVTLTPTMRENIDAVRGALNSGIMSVALGAAVFGVFVGLLGGDGLRGKLLWMGLALLVPALMVLGLGLAMGQGNASWLNSATAEFRVNGDLIHSDFNAATLAVIENIFQRIGSSFTITGLLAGVVSLILIFAGLVLPAGASSQMGGSRFVEVPVGGEMIDVSPKAKRKEKPLYDEDASLAPRDDDGDLFS